MPTTREKKNLTIIGGGILALLAGMYLVRGRLFSYAGEIWDDTTAEQINKLHPAIRDRVRQFILEMQSKGINLRIPLPYGGYRTFEQQVALYAQGRDGNPGPIVTNALPMESYHNYGLAFDVVEINNIGQPIWDNPNWPLIGETGQKYGFIWGPGGNPTGDQGHFETQEFGNIAELRRKYDFDDLDAAGYVN